MGGGGGENYSSSGKGGSGGKGNMGTVEAILNPVGYVVPETRKWDPVSSLVAPKIDKMLGTEAGNKQYEQQWKDYYGKQEADKVMATAKTPKEQTAADPKLVKFSNTSLMGEDTEGLI